LKAEYAAEAKRQRVIEANGVVWAREEADTILRRLAEVASSSEGILIGERMQGRIFVLRGGTLSVRVEWHDSYENSLNDSELSVVLWDNTPVAAHSVRVVRQRAFHFDVTTNGSRQWQEKHGQAFPTESIVSEAVQMLTDQMRKRPQGR
jgi:hypothetical protein